MHQGFHVKASGFGGFQNLRQGQLARLGQSPQSGAAHAASAVGQHGCGQGIQQGTKFTPLFVSDFAGDHWQVMGLQPQGLGSLCNLIETDLVCPFAVGAVAHDGPKAGLLQGWQITGLQLSADAQMRTDLDAVHVGFIPAE